MTVTITTAPHWQYTGDGTTTSYPYTSLLLAAEDLRVYVGGVIKTLAIDYTVTGLGVPTGGNVVFVTAPAVLPIDILRVTTPDQQRTLPLSGSFASTAVERMVDDVVNMIQEDRRDLRRTLLLDLLSDSSDLTLPEPVAGRGLRWNAAGSGLENIDLTTILAAAATLPLSVANGGTGTTTALGVRQAIGVDGQVRMVLTNSTGVTLAAGDVVAISTAGDNAVVLGDTVSSKAQFGVALASIANATTGEFLLAGVATVNVSGSVTRGRYLRKSATTRVAEDSGTVTGAATTPPTGTIGLALTASAGSTVTAWVFGYTYPGSTTPIITGLPRVMGLTGVNTVAFPTTQYDYAATSTVVRDWSSGDTLVLPTVATRTLNVATAGPAAGGRDQAGAFSANSWIHAYLIAKPDGTYHVTASSTAPSTGPALPSGYTLWAYLGALRIDNSSALILTRTQGARAYYLAAQAVVADGRLTVETTVDVASRVPPTAPSWLLVAAGFSNPTFTLRFRLVTGVDYDTDGATAGGSQGPIRLEITLPNVGQQYLYLYGADPGVNAGHYGYVRGYENPI